MKTIPVIDLFAGPGGLSEGFSTLYERNMPCFKIALSIEKEPNAHSTLELRSFYRQFGEKKAPQDYYRFLKQEITIEELYDKFPDEAAKARSEAKLATLGKIEEKQVDQWICEAIHGNKNGWDPYRRRPPCQAYSLAGRSRNKGISGYKPEDDDRHYLYKEYLRIIAKHWPSIFVMENVKGLLSSKIEGKRVFDNIFMDLVNPGIAIGTEEKFRYRIYSLVETSDSIMGTNNRYIIKSEDYGVPQARHRVILLGVRESKEFDQIKPEILQPVVKKITTWDVIADLPKIRSGLSGISNFKTWTETICDINASDWYHEIRIEEKEKLNDKLFELNKNAQDMPELGSLFMETYTANPSKLWEWYVDEKLHGVCNHITRNQMPGDLFRYFYAACFAELYGKSAKLNDLPRQLLPAHKNIEEAIRSKNLFSDRFRVQLPGRPSTTITSHIAKDGHYYIHPDPVQCRCLSVRKVVRLQTFPDNYFFCGSRTAQYTQVGNAVPPLLANKIARIVSNLLYESRRNHG